METFLTSIGTGQYNAMAAALVQMGAADSTVDTVSFARDLEKIFTAVQVFSLEEYNLKKLIKFFFLVGCKMCACFLSSSSGFLHCQ